MSKDSRKITLDQETYIESVLKKIGMQDSNPSESPAANNFKLVKATEVEHLVDETLYRSLVGSLLNIAEQTRPDIVWIVKVPSWFIDKPANSHWLAGQPVLRYLQATKSPKPVCSRDSDYNLTGESDADWSGVHDDRRSTTGFFFKQRFSRGAVVWQTKKQQTVALSSCKAEYQSLAAAVQEATFLRSLICEMGNQQLPATVIGEDNQSCIKLATNPVMHKMQAYRYKISLHWRKNWWQLSSAGLHANWSTGSRSVDETISTSESGATSRITIGSNADSFSRQRNNLSEGVEGRKLDKLLELQNKIFSHNSSKSRRNKLTWWYSKLFVIESSTFGKKIWSRLTFNNDHTEVFPNIKVAN